MIEYEDFDELIEYAKNLKKDFTEKDYELIKIEIEKIINAKIINSWQPSWSDYFNILYNLKDFAISLIDKNQNNIVFCKDIIEIMDKVADWSLDIEPIDEDGFGSYQICETNRLEMNNILVDTIKYIRKIDKTCCKDIFYRYAILTYDKVEKIIYGEEKYNMFEEFQTFEELQYRLNEEYVSNYFEPFYFEIKLVMSCSEYEDAPQCTVKISNIDYYFDYSIMDTLIMVWREIKDEAEYEFECNVNFSNIEKYDYDAPYNGSIFDEEVYYELTESFGKEIVLQILEDKNSVIKKIFQVFLENKYKNQLELIECLSRDTQYLEHIDDEGEMYKKIGIKFIAWNKAHYFLHKFTNSKVDLYPEEYLYFKISCISSTLERIENNLLTDQNFYDKEK